MLTSRAERYLLHQVHPAKLATDMTVSLVSNALFWRRRLLPGLLVFAIPPVIASALLMRRDLSGLRRSPAGRYVVRHMPPSMQAVRAVSAVVTAVGAWRRKPSLILAGLGLTALGWSNGLFARGGSRHGMDDPAHARP